MKKFIYCIIALTVLASCSKDDSAEESKDIEVAQDNAIGELISEDVNIISDEAYNKDKLITRAAMYPEKDSAIITKVAGKMTIDFGVKGILCKDGIVRKGKIIVQYIEYAIPNNTRYQEFDNYSMGGNQLSNTSFNEVTYNGRDTFDNYFWSLKSRLNIVKAGSTQVMNWSCSRTRSWIYGDSTTTDLTDDVYMQVGVSSGKTYSGYNYSTDIDTNSLLIFNSSCPYIGLGALKFTRGNRKSSLDYSYGGGSCDNRALLSMPSKKTYELFQ